MFEVAVPHEVFGTDRSDILNPGYEARLVPIGDRVRLSSGFVLEKRWTCGDLSRADTVIVPALESVDADIPPPLVEALLVARTRGARIVGLGTGAFALGAAGLLDGIPATTHWMYTELLAQRHPLIKLQRDILYAGTDRVMTSAGTAAGLDACLELVRRDHGAAISNDFARRMVISPQREGGQAQFIPAHKRTVAGEFSTLTSWVHEHVTEPISVQDMAAVAAMSIRTLTRRFQAQLGQTPGRWLIEQRVRRSQELLETTDLTISRIAAEVGFETVQAFRINFVRVVGRTPRDYRRLFSAL